MFCKAEKATWAGIVIAYGSLYFYMVFPSTITTVVVAIATVFVTLSVILWGLDIRKRRNDCNKCSEKVN